MPDTDTVLPTPPVTVPRETEQRLRSFLDLLLRWNARINLVAKAPAEHLWQRHVVDSVQLVPLVPAVDPAGEGVMADLGSGGGFPGVVLATVLGRPMHLVESDRRKSAFLLEAGRVLGLRDFHVHPARIEAVDLPPISVLSARALAPLTDLLPHASRFLAPGGVAIFPKGRTAEMELTAAAADWTMRVERFASRTDSQSLLLRCSEIRRAGA